MRLMQLSICQGGMICENNAIYGGGIDVDYGSNVTLTGGSISNNISGQGAGVYLTRASNISMKEGRNGQKMPDYQQ